MRRLLPVLLLFTFIPAAASPAAAQDDPWGGIRVGVSAGVLPEGSTFTQESDLVQYVEPAPVRAATDKKAVPFVDAGIVVPVHGLLGVHASFSALKTSGAASVEAGIPHPFFFDALRPVSGQVDMERLEMALHGGLSVLVFSGPVDIVLSGGPSWFRLRQDLVTEVEFDEAYPYDEASFRSARVAEANRSALGFHAGADVTWLLSRAVGIGALVRYSRAEVDLEASRVEVSGVRVGGLHVGAGVRFLIP